MRTGAKKTIQISLRVTEEEKKLLDKISKKHNITISDFLMQNIRAN